MNYRAQWTSSMIHQTQHGNQCLENNFHIIEFKITQNPHEAFDIADHSRYLGLTQKLNWSPIDYMIWKSGRLHHILLLQSCDWNNKSLTQNARFSAWYTVDASCSISVPAWYTEAGFHSFLMGLKSSLGIPSRNKYQTTCIFCVSENSLESFGTNKSVAMKCFSELATDLHRKC